MGIPLVKVDHLFAVSGILICKIDSAEWLEWLQNNDSFRFEDRLQYSSDLGVFTARKEKNDYWYGYRKFYGKLHKKYIGKSEQCTAKKLKTVADGLEAICIKAMNAPKAVSPKVTEYVTTALVAETVTQDKIAELESRLQTMEEQLEKLKLSETPTPKPLKPESELDDSVGAALVCAEDAKKTAAFFGFTPDEALADAYFQINMLTSNYDELEDKHEALKRKYAELKVQPSIQPIMETVNEIERLRQALSATDRLLITKNAAIAKLESELSTARQKILEADLEVDKLESELVSCQSTQSKNSATVGTDLSKVEPADLLNQLKARRKKSKADLADMDAVLDLLSPL